MNFNDYGWNFSVNNPAITFSEVSLDPLAIGHDWSYRFTATSDGEITLAYDISLVSGSGFGLEGWQVSFTGPGGTGGPVFNSSIRRSRAFSLPLSWPAQRTGSASMERRTFSREVRSETVPAS